MVAFILEAVNPSVDSPGLARCCRHEAVPLARVSFRGESKWNVGPWTRTDTDHQPESRVGKGVGDLFGASWEGVRRLAKQEGAGDVSNVYLKGKKGGRGTVKHKAPGGLT